jgi:hypothetical protein
MAAKNLDGSPLYNAATPPAPVAITRAAVSEDSATGIVDVYFATDAGAPSADDVTAANTNIEAQIMACPDAMTYTGQAASELVVPVVGVVWVKAAPGLTVASVQNAISAAMAAYQPKIPIGGFKLSTARPGELPVTDLLCEARGAWPGIFEAAIYTPAHDTTMTVNQVALLSSPPAYWSVNVVP